MCRRNDSKRRRAVAAIAVVLGTTSFAGCADSEPGQRASDTSSTGSADEVARPDGDMCPARLPQGEDPGYGFGTEKPAEASPALSAPESAWTCRYHPVDGGPGPDGQGTAMVWERDGGAGPVSSTALPEIEESLSRLAPPDTANQMCTQELGPRWMLVLASGQDLTGVVVDGFGCRNVRLTDDPFETVPGASKQEGIVPGVLMAPPSLLEDLKGAHTG
jgi:hypothetical protein